MERLFIVYEIQFEIIVRRLNNRFYRIEQRVEQFRSYHHHHRIKLSRDQLQIRRAEITKISNESSLQSTPFSASTVITPMPRLSFAQQ